MRTRRAAAPERVQRRDQSRDTTLLWTHDLELAPAFSVPISPVPFRFFAASSRVCVWLVTSVAKARSKKDT